MANQESKATSQSAKTASEEKKDVGQTATAPQSNQLSPEQIEAKLKELKQGFSRLGNREKELEAKAKEYEFYIKSFPELKAKAERAEQLEKLLATDPYAAVKMVASNPVEAFGKVTTGFMSDKPEMQAIQSLSKEIQKLQGKLESFEKARTAEEEERRKAAFYAQLEKVTEKFPIIHNSKSWAAVETMLEKLKASGEEPDLEKAAELAEKGLKEEIKKVIKAKAFTKEELLSLLEEKLSEEANKFKDNGAPKVKDGNGSAVPPSTKPLTRSELRRRGPEILKKILEQKQKAG